MKAKEEDPRLESLTEKLGSVEVHPMHSNDEEEVMGETWVTTAPGSTNEEEKEYEKEEEAIQSEPADPLDHVIE